MGAAISGMHYTGMAASRFSRDAYCIGGLPIDNQWLALVIGLITVALLAITLITAVFDAHLQSQSTAPGAAPAGSQRGAAAAGGEGAGQ